MTVAPALDALKQRKAPLAMPPGEFREIGHRLVDQIADRLATLADAPVTRHESPAELRRLIGAAQALPAAGTDAGGLIRDAADLLFDHSLFNGHPRFFGYITSSPAPIGMLGDFLAAALNQNVGAQKLAPLATEIEAQTVRWIAELIGFPGGGGLLVSGGNMANFVCLAAARAAKAPGNIRKEGLSRSAPSLLVYASTDTHGWIRKAADLLGLGTDAIRWIDTDAEHRLDATALRDRIDEDLRLGHHPFAVVGTAGSIGTGAVDPLPEIGAICREYGLWFHVDGAYGALAAQAAGSPASLRALSDADSVAVDPHKWLYAPLEAGCVLVRDADALRHAFSYQASYYHFDDDSVVNYYDYGPQNSRGFRALKVWLALRQVGRAGYLQMIADDMALAQHLHRLMAQHPEFEATSQSLSVTTFRYVPPDLRAHVGSAQAEACLNRLNQRLLTAVEQSGEAFLSNALIDGRFVLRACIVNFHTSLDDIEALPALLSRLGREVDQEPRSEIGRLTGECS
jgi:aromatic-L-amino-acid decarboxylase